MIKIYMTEKHLLFLDYLLPILSKTRDGDFIDDIAYEYEKKSGISFDNTEVSHFESLYEYQYFTFPYSTNRTAKITPETKEIIDSYGSLSKYLNIVAESNTIEQVKIDTKEQLETDLAKSNIEANKLNAKIAELNRKDSRLNKIFLIINAVFAVINIAIAILQLMKPAK